MMNNIINVIFAAIISIGICSISYLVVQIILQIKKQKKSATMLIDKPNIRNFPCYDEVVADVTAPISNIFNEETTAPILAPFSSGITYACLRFMKYAGCPSQQKEFIEKKETTLGRGRGNDISVNDASVSKYHISILYEEDKIWIIDHNTTNGTFIDERKAIPEKKELVSESATIYIGKTSFNIEKCNFN